MSAENGKKDDDIWEMLAIPFGIAVMVGLIYLFYTNHRIEVNYFVLSSAKYMLAPLALFSDEKARIIEQINHADLSKLGITDLVKILNYSNFLYAFLFVPMTIYFIYNITKKDLHGKYRRFFDMVTLVENNARVLPFLKPIINRDKAIIEEPNHTGPWALPVKPIQWIAKNELLLDKDNKPFPKKMMLDSMGMPQTSPDKTILLSQSVKVRQSIGAHLDKEKTKKLLLKQLGDRLESNRSKIASSLKDYEAGMVASLIAYGLGDKKKGYGYICMMAESFVEGEWNEETKTATGYQLNIGDAREYITSILSKEELDDNLELTFKLHGAYKYTWIMSLLEDFASKKNVFNSGLYVGFLRPTDNLFFLSLNQVGSNTGWIEAYGVWAHYEMEKVARYNIIDTEYSMELAFNYLNQYLESQGWIGWSHSSYDK
jgi:hypothetical protein